VACPTTTTIYTLYVTDAVTGCTVSDQVSVMVNDAASPSLTGGTTTSCPAMAVILPLAVSPAGSYQYVWSPAVELNDPFVSNPVSYPTTSRTYNVTVNSLSNFCSNIASSTVNVSTSLCFLLNANFLSFAGVNNKTENLLRWKVDREKDIKHYIVERSESTSFSLVGIVIPEKTGASVNDYQFRDKNIFSGKSYYYRIKAADMSGKYIYSSIIKINTSAKEGFDVVLYPNPATTRLQIQASVGTLAGNTFTVYNLDGKELKRGKLQNNATLDISNFINGYYFIRIMSGKQVVIKSFLIAR
jgi:hypothetical protein